MNSCEELVERDCTGMRDYCVSVDRYTRSIAVMDTFESLGDNYNRIYDRLIFCCAFSYQGRQLSVGGDYVIERLPNGTETEGDITFSAFKSMQDERFDLRNYTVSEIYGELDSLDERKRFIRFSVPYLFRAQTSRNREYGGWEHGRQYGDTTRYGVVGVEVRLM